MGLDYQSIRFLLAARERGVSFDRVLTIGRQGLLLTPAELRRAHASFGREMSRARARELIREAAGFADLVLRDLGAREVDAADVSEYEGAALIHDLNEPLPERWKGRYSLVIDGGSLEHIFHIGTALGNLMELVEVGGHLVLVNPANNLFGHGFYQLGPDFYFSALGEENGYRVDHAVACELRRRARWYLVADPAAVRRRVRLVNRFPVYFLVQAKRVADRSPFQSPPAQAKYQRLWSRSEKEGAPAARRRPNAVQKWVESVVRATIKPRFNPKCYRRIEPRDLCETGGSRR